MSIWGCSEWDDCEYCHTSADAKDSYRSLQHYLWYQNYIVQFIHMRVNLFLDRMKPPSASSSLSFYDILHPFASMTPFSPVPTPPFPPSYPSPSHNLITTSTSHPHHQLIPSPNRPRHNTVIAIASFSAFAAVAHHSSPVIITILSLLFVHPSCQLSLNWRR